MRRFQPKFLLLCLSLLGIILGGIIAALNQKTRSENRADCGFTLANNGQRISWHSVAPIQIVMHETLTPEFRNSLAQAVETWNQALGRTVFVIGKEISSGNPETSSENLVWLKKDNWQGGFAAQKTGQVEQAITNLSKAPQESTQIRIAQIVINGQARFFSERSTGTQESHIESLLIHELGHVLGLAHTENTIMQESLSAGQIRTVIDPQTIDNVNCEYSISRSES